MKYIVKKERDIIVGDLHFPFINIVAWNSFLEFVSFWKPKNIYINGDCIDCYTISEFAKDLTRKDTFNDERNQAIVELAKLRKCNKSANIYWITGNHEDRINKWKNKDVNLANMEEMSIDNLYKVNDSSLKIKVIQDMELRLSNRNGFIILHGDRYGKNTASTYSSLYRCNGANGHSHKLEEFVLVDKTNGNKKPNYWYQTGCLCQEKPIWSKDGIKDWHVGFLIGEWLIEEQEYRISLVRWENGNFYAKDRIF